MRQLLLAVLAAAVLSNAAKAETIVVGVEDIQYFPHYTWESGEYGGFGRAFLDAWAEANGHTLEFKAMSINRLMRAVVDQQVDLKYPDNAFWATDLKEGKGVVYSEPVTPFIDGVSVLPDRKGQSAEDVKTLGTVVGFTAWDWLDRINAGSVELAENGDFTALVRQGLRGRVDGIYSNVTIVNYVLNNILEQPGALVFDENLPHTASNYHVSSAKRPDLIDSINAFISANPEKIAAIRKELGIGE